MLKLNGNIWGFEIYPMDNVEQQKFKDVFLYMNFQRWNNNLTSSLSNGRFSYSILYLNIIQSSGHDYILAVSESYAIILIFL